MLSSDKMTVGNAINLHLAYLDAGFQQFAKNSSDVNTADPGRHNSNTNLQDLIKSSRNPLSFGMWFERVVSLTIWALTIAMVLAAATLSAGILLNAAGRPAQLSLYVFWIILIPLLLLMVSILRSSIALVFSSGGIGLVTQMMTRSAVAMAGIAWQKATKNKRGANRKENAFSQDWDRIQEVLSHELIRPWITKWILQRLVWVSLAFQIAAFASLVLLAGFQDISFYWGSTVSNWQSEKGLAYSVYYMLFSPFNWEGVLVSLDQLLHFSRYNQFAGLYQYTLNGDQLNNGMYSGNWIPYLASALVLYGIAPRVIWLAVLYKKNAGLVYAFQNEYIPLKLMRNAAPLLRDGNLGNVPGLQGDADKDDTKATRNNIELGSKPYKVIRFRGAAFPPELQKSLNHYLGGEPQAEYALGGKNASLEDISKGGHAELFVLVVDCDEPPVKFLKHFMESQLPAASGIIIVPSMTKNIENLESGPRAMLQQRLDVWQGWVNECNRNSKTLAGKLIFLAAFPEWKGGG